LWYEERSDKCKRLKQVDFSLCCQKGKVQLPLLKKPPQLLQKLLKGERHYKPIFLTVHKKLQQHVLIYIN